jgi:hypothetical protein
LLASTDLLQSNMLLYLAQYEKILETVRKNLLPLFKEQIEESSDYVIVKFMVVFSLSWLHMLYSSWRIVIYIARDKSKLMRIVNVQLWNFKPNKCSSYMITFLFNSIWYWNLTPMPDIYYNFSFGSTCPLLYYFWDFLFGIVLFSSLSEAFLCT